MSESSLLALLRAARGAGVRISTAETLEALEAAALVGPGDRTDLRDTLALVCAKSADEKRLFEDVFSLFFAPQKPAAPKLPAVEERGAGGEAQGGGGGSGLARMILEGDRAGLDQALADAARAEDAQAIRFFTQTNALARRMLDRMGLAALEAEIAADADPRLREGLDMLRAEARAEAERNLRLFGREESEALREYMLRRARLAAISPRERARLASLTRAMAKKLATRHSRRRRVAKRGTLDLRGTLRRNMGWDGIPFLLRHRATRVARPRLVVFCDISGSVAALSGFLLLFLHSLGAVVRDLGAFVFTGEAIDVTTTLKAPDAEAAIARILAEHGNGSSNYGTALAGFARDARIDRHTTVVILGDGRGNRAPPRVDALEDIARRARQLVWLNPEHPALWGTGDSDMPRYAPFCRQLRPCRTLDELERAVDGLLLLHRA
ncbi:MAG: hypothetical protein JWO26_2158 [Rhodospirillales bacterium]|nr:hypothetical protein [Rhodospirillales bacterium]